MDKATNVSNFFHGYARDFDAIYGTKDNPLNRVVNRYLRQSMQLRFSKSLQGCFPIKDRTVLDVGTGPGHYAVALAEEGGIVTGVDFAEGMIEIARAHAKKHDVEDRCTFLSGDFWEFEPESPFDYCIAMGFMDYIGEPERLIDKVMGMTTEKAFFSFPIAEGLLAWQRKLRYKSKCDLFLYSRERVAQLFSLYDHVRIELIHRDYFVTVART